MKRRTITSDPTIPTLRLLLRNAVLEARICNYDMMDSANRDDREQHEWMRDYWMHYARILRDDLRRTEAE